MAKPVGYLKRQRRARKGKPVTVRYADGTTELVKAGAFSNNGRRGKPRPRTEYERYLRSDHWKRVRRAALERDNYHCRGCGVGGFLEVHHHTYERMGCELLEDVVSLCQKCHADHHSGFRPAPIIDG